jgi:predicted homoserine dehydrogenase-like protein
MDFRGSAVRFSESEDAPPIGLLNGARLRNSVITGQMITASDVDIPDSIAKTAWDHTVDSMDFGNQGVLAGASSPLFSHAVHVEGVERLA